MSIEKLIEKTLNEGNVSIQVVDSDVAILQLKKYGVPAKVDPKYDDEILVDLKYKKQILKWMLSDEGGWDKRDLMGVYDELLESCEEDENPVTESTEITIDEGRLGTQLYSKVLSELKKIQEKIQKDLESKFKGKIVNGTLVNKINFEIIGSEDVAVNFDFV